MSVRVRIPPSPTGNLHLGTAYTALFNYLFAKKNKGNFILRFEDTDLERNRVEFEENIIDGLKWLNLNWDEGPFKQTERLKNYDAAINKMLSQGSAYYCFCTIEELEGEKKDQQAKKLPVVYSGRCRNLNKEEVDKKLSEGTDHVLRIKTPENRGMISWEDLVFGKVEFDSKLIGDFIIARTTGMPLYNLAVVVDDIDMGITHVLRGEDHLSNTPKQILIFDALDHVTPIFGHWPNILNPDRVGKLSKREGATAVTEYRDDGFLPEAVVNYLGLLGWSMPGDLEIMGLKDMEEAFDIKRMKKSPAAFDVTKLEWMNGEYIRDLSDEELSKRLQDYLRDYDDKEKIARITPLIKERIKKLSDVIEIADFLFNKPEYDFGEFKKLKLRKEKREIKDVLVKIIEKLKDMGMSWKAEEFEKTFREMAPSLDLSITGIFQLIRLAISGQLITPPLFESIKILGEEETLERFNLLIDQFDTLPDESKDLDIETSPKK